MSVQVINGINKQAYIRNLFSSFSDVVKVQTLLADLNDFGAYNEVYQKAVTDKCKVPPARTTFQAGAMPLNSR